VRKFAFNLSVFVSVIIVGNKISAQVEPRQAKAPKCGEVADQISNALDGTYYLAGFSVENGMTPAKFTVTILNGTYKSQEQAPNSQERRSTAVIKTGAHPDFIKALQGRILDNSCFFKTEMDLRNNGASIKLTIVQQWSSDNSPRIVFYLVPEGGGTPQALILLYDKDQKHIVDKWGK